MYKIPFEDGQLVSTAYVKEDGTIEEAKYSGNTPLSAFNLNKMQDNIEEAIAQTSTDLEQHRYYLTLTEELADNSELTIPCYYKVRKQLFASTLRRLFIRERYTLYGSTEKQIV